MFSSSTQRAHWMYESAAHLEGRRTKSNEKAGASLVESGKMVPENLLTVREEYNLVRSYLANLKKFCKNFAPPMRKETISTAFIYMKRFYLNESCMEFHPRDIGVTCAYLACKVDEFNISIDQFIKNVNGDCSKAQRTVLSNELLVMKKLRFHLTVHLPYRAVEGFLIDLRARYPQSRETNDQMAQEIDDYLEKSMFTDASFLYTPSQIALSAVNFAAQKSNLDLGPYLRDILFSENPSALRYIYEASSSIEKLIESDLQNSPGKDVIKKIEKKLSQRE